MNPEAAEKVYEQLSRPDESADLVEEIAEEHGYHVGEFRDFVFGRHDESEKIGRQLWANFDHDWANQVIRDIREGEIPSVGAGRPLSEVSYQTLEEAVGSFYLQLGEDFSPPPYYETCSLADTVAEAYQLESEAFLSLVMGCHSLFEDWLAVRISLPTQYGWLDDRVRRARQDDDEDRLRAIEEVPLDRLVTMAETFFERLRRQHSEFHPAHSSMEDVEQVRDRLAAGVAQAHNVENGRDQVYLLLMDHLDRSRAVLSGLEHDYGFDWLHTGGG